MPTKIWTSIEDQKLVHLVQNYGIKRWKIVASKFSERTAKQCRERYNEHANPQLYFGPVTVYEEETIDFLYTKFGPKWAVIAKRLPRRCKSIILCLIDFLAQGFIKNYINRRLRERLRTTILLPHLSTWRSVRLPAKIPLHLPPIHSIFRVNSLCQVFRKTGLENGMEQYRHRRGSGWFRFILGLWKLRRRNLGRGLICDIDIYFPKWT